MRRLDCFWCTHDLSFFSSLYWWSECDYDSGEWGLPCTPPLCITPTYTHTQTNKHTNAILCVTLCGLPQCWELHETLLMSISPNNDSGKKNTFSCTHATFSFRTGLGNMLHLRKWFNITSILSVLWWSHISKWLDWISSCIAIMLLFFDWTLFWCTFLVFFFLYMLVFRFDCSFYETDSFFSSGTFKSLSIAPSPWSFRVLAYLHNVCSFVSLSLLYALYEGEMIWVWIACECGFSIRG